MMSPTSNSSRIDDSLTKVQSQSIHEKLQQAQQIQSTSAQQRNNNNNFVQQIKNNTFEHSFQLAPRQNIYQQQPPQQLQKQPQPQQQQHQQQYQQSQPNQSQHQKPNQFQQHFQLQQQVLLQNHSFQQQQQGPQHLASFNYPPPSTRRLIHQAPLRQPYHIVSSNPPQTQPQFQERIIVRKRPLTPEQRESLTSSLSVKGQGLVVGDGDNFGDNSRQSNNRNRGPPIVTQAIYNGQNDGNVQQEQQQNAVLEQSRKSSNSNNSRTVRPDSRLIIIPDPAPGPIPGQVYNKSFRPPSFSQLPAESYYGKWPSHQQCQQSYQQPHPQPQRHQLFSPQLHQQLSQMRQDLSSGPSQINYRDDQQYQVNVISGNNIITDNIQYSKYPAEQHQQQQQQLFSPFHHAHHQNHHFIVQQHQQRNSVNNLPYSPSNRSQSQSKRNSRITLSQSQLQPQFNKTLNSNPANPQQHSQHYYEAKRWQNKFQDLTVKHEKLLQKLQNNTVVQDNWMLQQENKLLREKIKILQSRDDTYFIELKLKVEQMVDYHRKSTLKECELLVDRYRLENRLHLKKGKN